MLRDAEPFDLAEMLRLGHMMHKESPVFRDMPLDEKKLTGTLTAAMLAPLGYLRIATEGDRILGGLVGFCLEYSFNHVLYATEAFTFIDPEQRGTLLAPRLLRDFEDWAVQKGAREVVLGISTGVHPEQTAALYERMGYKQQGTIHRKLLGLPSGARAH